MPGLSETHLLLGLLAVALVLVMGRLFGEIARRLGQAEVLGELLAGVLLGPSVLGLFAPDLRATLFLTWPVSDGLSLLSWIGAILLLLVAGMEVDLRILRRFGKVSALAGSFAVVSALVVGIVFAIQPLPPPAPDAFSLGIILSVTAVSVVSAFLLEHTLARRNFAQVILVAGVASETLAWVLVALASSIQSGSPLVAAQALVAAVLFFLAMMTIGWRLTFWAMRRVADFAHLAYGQLTLVLVLTLACAAITQNLGLHPLLGAFVFGILLGQSPRTSALLKQQLEAIAVGVFGPIFFVLAGMRVDLLQMRIGAVMIAIILLLLVATVVKVGMGMLGASVGGMPRREALLVGIGLNFKGGTDVVVAIVLTELGMLSDQAYTMYAVVAVVTVLFSVPLFTRIEHTVAPATEERTRLDLEEVKRRSYFSHVERIIVPLLPALQPVSAASVADVLARAKRANGEFFDITALEVGPEPPRTVPTARPPGPEMPGPGVAPAPLPAPHPAQTKQADPAVVEAHVRLFEARQVGGVDLTTERMQTEDQAVEVLLSTPAGGTLIALGGCRPENEALSLGPLQDRIVNQAESDVLVVLGASPACGLEEGVDLTSVKRILAPVVSLQYSLAASEVAAYLAKGLGAELLVLAVVPPGLTSGVSNAPGANGARQETTGLDTLNGNGDWLLRSVERRLGPLGVPMVQRVVVAADPAEAISRELAGGSYQVVVLGVVNRGRDDELDLGNTARDLLPRCVVPAVLLVSH